jgi:hypothetical protein
MKVEDLKVMNTSFELGNFAKDSSGKVWYTFEGPNANEENWHDADLTPPNGDSFGDDERELSFMAWKALYALVKGKEL